MKQVDAPSPVLRTQFDSGSGPVTIGIDFPGDLFKNGSLELCAPYRSFSSL